MPRRFRVGDPIVFIKNKIGDAPGPRAKNVIPAAHGEIYSYEVEKYWRVVAIPSNETVLAVTRTGKCHEIPISDRRLRHARFWERLFFASRFPVSSAVDSQPRDSRSNPSEPKRSPT